MNTYMSLGKKAFKELFPKKVLTKNISISYSNKFKSYNANVKYTAYKMEFSLSKNWKSVSEEIQIGLIQSLLLKIYKEKKTTLSIELYESFLKNIPKFSTVTKIDPLLSDSFDRVNKIYFHDYLDKPNLVWGQESFAKLGSYEYASDKITISKVLRDNFNLLDYVMHHEMLHKKLKFNSKNGRNYHHTAEFRRLERQYEDKDAEKKLTSFIRKKRLKKVFRFF